MVVPYLRNQRRNPNTPVAIKPKSQYQLEPSDQTIIYVPSTHKHVGRRTKKGGTGGGYLFKSNQYEIKSQYHLEPDQTIIYETSTYKHVGRRTKKSGTGGGYLYKSNQYGYDSSSSDDYGEDTMAGAITGYIILCIFSLALAYMIFLWLSACGVNLCRHFKKCFERLGGRYQRRRQRQEAVRHFELQEHRREQSEESDANVWHLRLSERYSQSYDDPEASAAKTAEIPKQMERRRLVRSKLHYQVVLADKSNTTAESIRNTNSADSKADEDDVTEVEDDDDDSVIGSEEVKALSGKKHSTRETSTKSSGSSVYFTLRNFLSFRSFKGDDCSICLECFAPCQTICVAKNSCCNHVFHEECIEFWLMVHDDCPNCRAKIID